MKKLLLFGALAFGLNTFGQVPSYVPTNGLIGWWPFNGNSNDESGNGNNATNNGAVLTNDRLGNPNSAYSVVNTHLVASPSNLPINNDPRSVSVWFKTQSMSYNPSTGFGANVVLSWGSTPSNCALQAVETHVGDLAVNHYACGPNTSEPVSDGNWHHVVASFDGTIELIYLDGQILETVSTTLATTNSSLYFGERAGELTNHQYNGMIDDIGVWNRALSACEVEQLYSSQVQSINTNVTQMGTQLTADEASGTYQWLDCDNNYAIINGETNQSYTPVVTGNYAVEVNMDGCVDTSACLLVDYTGIEELLQTEKELVKIIDFMGRETEYKPNTPLIFIYSDGTRERVMKLEE